MGTEQVLPSWKESLSMPGWWSTASGDWKQDECVKVVAMRGCIDVDADEKKFTPVMVRVTAAPRPRLRTPVDVVALLDVSSSMKGKMVEMKEAMQVVIDNLGADNRLCIVLFDDKHRVVLGLTDMTKEGRIEATKVIGNWLSTAMIPQQEFSNQSVADALGAADKILMGRPGLEGDGRLGCIMLLSGGEDKNISSEVISLEELKFPVHTFGLGADHEARSFQFVASKTAGTYSFISNGKTTDAFKAFVGGLTSVVATSVKISIKAQAGVNISSIVTGSHKEVVQIQGSCHDIEIVDMYAGETKNFIVYLQTQSAEVVVSAATTVEKLVTVNGSYQLGSLLPAKEITVVPHDSSLLGAGSNTTVAAAVAAELLRIRLVNLVTGMVELQGTNRVVQELQLEWESIKISKEYQGADSTALSELEKDVAEMMTKPLASPYMLSWLSCHQWQRATTMSHHSCGFKVRAVAASAWEWKWKFFTNRGSWCNLAVCGVVFLFALLVMLLFRRHGIFSGSPPGTKIFQPTPLDIMRHPSWPSMKDNLGHLLDLTKQVEITSFFHEQEASSHDMNQQIDRYLYMAIVYAAVLRARYDGTAEISEAVVRQQAEVYLHSMLKMTKQYALPSMEDASLEHVTGEMSRYLYSTIVQANVLVTIGTPPVPQPDEDKDVKIRMPPVPQPDDDKDVKIRQLEELIIKLRIEITTLRTQKDSCCRGAIRCRNKVKELGGSVDDDVETYVVDTAVYYDQVKEISSLK